MAATAGSRPLPAPATASASASALSPSSAAAEGVVPRWLKGAFRTALEIIRQLPKDGPVQFSQEDKFKVRLTRPTALHTPAWTPDARLDAV